MQHLQKKSLIGKMLNPGFSFSLSLCLSLYIYIYILYRFIILYIYSFMRFIYLYISCGYLAVHPAFEDRLEMACSLATMELPNSFFSFTNTRSQRGFMSLINNW